MQSLKDKLLKAGLVSEEAVKKAEAAPVRQSAPPRRDERPPRRDDRPPPRRDDRPVREERVPKFAPLAGSAAANREASRKQLALDKLIREKVLAAQVPIDDGATPFYFVTRKQKLRRLTLTEPQAKRIQDGELAIVERPDPDKIDYALVPPEVAKELLVLSARTVRFLKAGDQSVGFVSDEDITKRAAEADAPETAQSAESRAAEDAPAVTEEEKPAEPETWITIKRATPTEP